MTSQRAENERTDPFVWAPSLERGFEGNSVPRALRLTPSQVISSDLSGNYRSLVKGSGLTLADLREYAPGDEVKHIHWKASARTGRTFIKTYEEERQLRVFAAVDYSPSCFGGSARSPGLIARRTALALATLSQVHRDAFGCALFDTEVRFFMEPTNRSRALHAITRELIVGRPLVGPTNLNKVLSELASRLRYPSMVFLITDGFSDVPFAASLRALSRRHDVTVLLIAPTTDWLFPDGGIISFRDAESTASRLIDTSSHSVRTAISEQIEKHLMEVSALAAGAGASTVRFTEDIVGSLTNLLKRKKRGGSR